MADQERTPATSAGAEQVELEHGNVLQDHAGPTAAESPTPGDEGAERTTAAPPVPETPEPTELDKRLKHLTEAPQPDPPPEATRTDETAKQPPPQDEKTPAEPAAEKPKALPELSEDVQKRMPKEAAKAFATMRTSLRESHQEAELYRAKVADLTPVAEFGRSLLETIGDAFKDLQALDDDEIRQAIQEQAAIKRGERQKPAGLTPDVVAKLTAALDAADESLDLTEVRRVLAEVTATAAPAAAKPPTADTPAPAAKPTAVQREDAAPHREAIQVMRTRNALMAEGIQPAQLGAYVQGRLIPAVLADLKLAFPGQDPAAVFNSISGADRHDLLLDKHRVIQAQTKKPNPPPKAPTNPQRTPLSHGATGRIPANGGPPASTNLADRLSYLTGTPG